MEQVTMEALNEVELWNSLNVSSFGLGPPIFKGKEVRSCKAQWVALELPSLKKVKHKSMFFAKWCSSWRSRFDHAFLIRFSFCFKTKHHNEHEITSVFNNKNQMESTFLCLSVAPTCEDMHLSFNVLTGMGSHEVESISEWVVEGRLFHLFRIWNLTPHGLFGGSLFFLISTLSLVNWHVW